MRRILSLVALSWLLAACSSDGGSKTETPLEVKQEPTVAAGAEHSCVLLASGNVYCWGSNLLGQLGLAGVSELGAAEVAGANAKVDVGGPVAQIACGQNHTCALLEDGSVKCWGHNDVGQLGSGSVGDSSGSPSSLAAVPLGGKAVAIRAGWNHTCALLDSGQVRCWGRGEAGQLGNGSSGNVGDDEPASASALVKLGGRVSSLAAGGDASCAIVEGVGARCWGSSIIAGTSANVGDDEPVNSVEPLALGLEPIGIAAGQADACAWSAADASCWGDNGSGDLGLGDTQPRTPGDGLLNLSDVQSITVARRALCVLSAGKVRCTGSGGIPGLGTMDTIGDDETLSSVGAIAVGGSVVAIAAGTFHVCALLDDDTVRCWGEAGSGQLGNGNTAVIGDDETPESVPALSFE